MKVYYASMSGNVRRFIRKSGVDAEEITSATDADAPFILVTYTIGFGEIPEKVQKFLDGNNKYLRGVAVSGNRNWGENFGKAGDLISKRYDVPLLMKFELAGSEYEVLKFKGLLEGFGQHETY